MKTEIPVNALRDIVEWFISEKQDSASARLAELLKLTVKYQEYFYAQPWPEKIDSSMTRPLETLDMDFIQTGGPEELKTERLYAALLRRNISHEGFSPITFVFDYLHYETELIKRPKYQPIIHQLHALIKQNAAPQDILHTLQTARPLEDVHAALILRVSDGYTLTEGKLLAQLLELLHMDADLPPCEEPRCKHQRERLRTPKTQGGYADLPLEF